VNQYSALEDKIALFRSLFRGRDDVYPRRFESRRTGKSGYAPACANEWVRDFVAGIYPMFLDETCFFLAVDFDKGTWQQDASATATCAISLTTTSLSNI
jgi:hypothetical protein